MKTDFAALNQDDLYDYCIIGAGPAGITCAFELSAAGNRVLLLEGGLDDITKQSQLIYEGTITGDPYIDLSVGRLRFFGGTSNHWAGYCRPLDVHDFENKGNFDTAWPISKVELDDYLKKASSILEIDDFAADEPLGDSGLNKISFEFSPPVRFLDKYYDQVVAHKNINLVLGANVTSFETVSGRITVAVIESYDGGKKKVVANDYILSTGGIENSRLLLWSNELSGGEVIKSPETLGHYWMEHPDFTIGSAVIKSNIFGSLQDQKTHFLAPTAAAIKQNNILNCGLRINPYTYNASKNIIADLACVAPELGRDLIGLFGKNLVCGYRLRASWEQRPLYTNCVTLETDKDNFEMPRVNLHWQKDAVDFKTIHQTTLLFGEYLARNNLGRVMLSRWVLDEEEFPDDDSLGGNHHMGGTRMAKSADKGIVDRNCRVFGQNNLYIAGSSVFPSAGFANPTLTIVQLALRLSDHLKTKS